MGLAFTALPLVMIALGCSDQPIGPDLSQEEVASAKGGAKGAPAQCNAGTNLRITFGDMAGDALQSDGVDGVRAYVEGMDNVGAHINDPTGRLMLWPSQYGATDRFVNVTTSADGGKTFPTKDRIYTNGHDTGDGEEDTCGLIDIPPGGEGDAVLEAELDAEGIVRFGKDCTGAAVDVSGNKRVRITRSGDGLSWTITGANGVHCRSNGLKGKPAFEEVGTAGPFSMTLETNS